MEPVTRAVCASICRIDGSVMNQLLGIRNELCGRERRSGARVALLWASGWLVLWVEGGEAAVERALARAAADPRNEHQTLLHRSRGAAVLRDPVVVATTHSPMRPSHFARWVMHMKSHGGAHEPLDIWNRLGAPCLVDAARRPCVRPVQQFAFVSADDHGPVDQLRKVGERWASPVVYQRFGVAHSHTPDLGMAYVDVPVEAGAVRIRLLSRRALAHGAMRRSMPNVDAVVLLIGARPEAAVEIAANVAETVKSAQHPPFVCVAGGSDDAIDACARLFMDSGVKPYRLRGAVGEPELAALLPALGVQPQGNSVSRSGDAPVASRHRMDGRVQVANLASMP